jgi:cell division protein FtsL
MATRRLTLSWQPLLVAGLVGFVLLAMGVIWRRTHGRDQARDIERLERRIDALDGERVRLETAIRLASIRARLEPIARRKLDMRIPAPEQVILLPRHDAAPPPPPPPPA